MSEYPESIFSPRAKENRSGVDYDPSKKTVIFVEDIQAIENEIISVEEDLEKIIVQAPEGAVVDLSKVVDYRNYSFLSSFQKNVVDNFGANFMSLPFGIANLNNAATYKTTMFLSSNSTAAFIYWIKFGEVDTSGMIALPAGAEYVRDMTVIDGYLYVVCGTSPVQVYKIDVLTHEIVASFTGNSGDNIGQAILVSNGYVMVGLATYPGKILFLDQDTLTQQTEIVFDTGYSSITDLYLIYNNLFVSFYTSPAKIAKVNFGDFSDITYYTAPTDVDYATAITSDSSFIFVSCKGDYGAIIKMRADDFSFVSYAQAPDPNTGLSDIVFDGSRLVASVASSPGQIQKFDPDDLSLVSTITFPAGYDYPDFVLNWYPGIVSANTGGSCKLFMGVFGDVNLLANSD